MAEFIYILTLESHLIEDENWTEADHQARQDHYTYLEGLLAEGKLVLAGRTQVKYPMGIVIIKAENAEEAQRITENDPAVKTGIMTSRVAPFKTALMR